MTGHQLKEILNEFSDEQLDFTVLMDGDDATGICDEVRGIRLQHEKCEPFDIFILLTK